MNAVSYILNGTTLTFDAANGALVKIEHPEAGVLVDGGKGILDIAWPYHTDYDTLRVNATAPHMGEAPQIMAEEGKVTVKYTKDGVDATTTIDVYVKEKEEPPVVEKPEVTGVTRLYGEDRFGTCLEIADAYKEVLGVEEFDTVIIATGWKSGDALSGSYLAYQKKAPIILTDATAARIENAVEYVKENLKEGGKVYILGGTAAVPEEVEVQLKADNFDVDRLAGVDRFETNLAILEEAGVKGGEIIVATAWQAGDSLSASATGKPILLVEKDKALNDKQVEFLNELTDAKFYIAGGTSAVADSVKEELSSYTDQEIERLFGASRIGTSIRIAEEFFKEPKAAIITYAYKDADGLCGGPLAAELGVPLLLTWDRELDATVEYTKAAGINAGYVLGGDGVVSDDTAVQVYALKDASEIIMPKAE